MTTTTDSGTAGGLTFENKVAFVTGASSGIGRDTALAFARAGAAVTVVDIDEAGAAETARLIADFVRKGGRLGLVCDLYDRTGIPVPFFGKPAPSVSQHLAKLRMARVVQTRREGTTVFYRLESDHVRQLVIDSIHHAQHQGPGTPAHHRSDRVVDLKGASR